MRNEIQIVLYTNVTGTNKITESCLSCFPALIKWGHFVNNFINNLNVELGFMYSFTIFFKEIVGMC